MFSNKENNIYVKTNNIFNLPNSPPHLSYNNIKKMNNKYQLKQLENKYDEFLDKYIQLMLLYNNGDEYLDTRDLLTIRISQI